MIFNIKYECKFSYKFSYWSTYVYKVDIFQMFIYIVHIDMWVQSEISTKHFTTLLHFVLT